METEQINCCTIREASEIIGISISGVAYLVKELFLSSVKTGGTFLLSRSDVEQYSQLDKKGRDQWCQTRRKKEPHIF